MEAGAGPQLFVCARDHGRGGAKLRSASSGGRYLTHHLYDQPAWGGGGGGRRVHLPLPILR